MAANADGLPLLHTFQKHIEDMRSLVQCKICIKPLYEPFILSCGHCYCYSCLTSWFTGGHGDHRRTQNMKCPDCRTAVVQEPSPNYVLRDLVHMFIGRTELLPEDETTLEHEIAKAEEAVHMTADRDGVGLFKGAFHNRGPPHPMLHAGFGRHGAMWDPNDRVDRCPECHWELEGGHCNQCDWSISDAEAFSDEDSDSEADEPDFDPATDRVRPRFNAGNFLRASENPSHPVDFDHELSDDPGSVITISSDVDDVDPVDHELADTDADTHSDAESDLPVAMGGLPRPYHRDAQMRLALERLYESDVQSTNYDDSEMGDTNAQPTSETGDSDDEDETEDDNSSEMEDFVDHDTPTHIPHRVLVQNRYDGNGDIYISSDNDESDGEGNTDREPSQAPTNITNASATTGDSSSEESSEDESRRTPVPRSRPSRQTRVILDDSEEEEQGQESPEDDENNADESDATTIPAQPTATRRSHLQSQRARRGPNALRRSSVSPPGRPSVPYNGGGSRRPLQAIANRRGMAQTYVAG